MVVIDSVAGAAKQAIFARRAISLNGREVNVTLAARGNPASIGLRPRLGPRVALGAGAGIREFDPPSIGKSPFGGIKMVEFELDIVEDTQDFPVLLCTSY
jgi:hypothetical protein